MKISGLSVVIPVYNSEKILPELAKRLAPALAKISEQYEVILVNDGSADRSWLVIETLAREHSWIRGVNLMRNYGQHNALLCGVREACYGIIVTMDDDLQHPPEEIQTLLAKLEEGYDVVYGTPENEKHELWRTLASQITKMALKSATGTDLARRHSAFRAFRTQLRDTFGSYRGPLVSIEVLLSWGTTRFVPVTVRHDPRFEGTSQYTFRKLVIHALNTMTGFSVWPLQAASIMGFSFTIFGFVVLIYVVGRLLVQGRAVPGFAFLASIIAIFSGAQLFALGIIGEYLARMHFRMMERPVYTVRSTTFKD